MRDILAVIGGAVVTGFVLLVIIGYSLDLAEPDATPVIGPPAPARFSVERIKLGDGSLGELISDRETGWQFLARWNYGIVRVR